MVAEMFEDGGFLSGRYVVNPRMEPQIGVKFSKAERTLKFVSHGVGKAIEQFSKFIVRYDLHDRIIGRVVSKKKPAEAG
jgi:hypothetical protein